MMDKIKCHRCNEHSVKLMKQEKQQYRVVKEFYCYSCDLKFTIHEYDNGGEIQINCWSLL